MNDFISELKYIGDRQGLEWFFERARHQLDFEHQIVAVLLGSGRGILVVEPASDDAPHNAIIYDAVGAIRRRMQNPEAGNGAICFCDAYYIGDDLALTIAFSSCQMRCFIDEAGEVLKIVESR
ncbi:hypothetical protein [Luteolibacter sp. LG18]|uniref:hypothetical protein n=1 Tax=Luteolibacter sp. LG18 TaxID=2819286 RepID=UPI002B2A8F8A|nr:hypothetical protein llg_27190 [Luteolibacter sp. LG18]